VSRALRTVGGDVAVPGDKSITHRALMLSAVAQGASRLRGLLPSADCRSTASVLRALGCGVADPPGDGGEVVVAGAGIASWRAPERPLDCGNSGTTARLMLGLLASRPFAATVTGDGSLRARPMRRVSGPLERMGAALRELGEPDRLPLEVLGRPLRPIEHASTVPSAQVKSAVLLAGVAGGVPVAVREPSPSRDHTERMLRGLGILVRVEAVDGGSVVRLEPPSAPLPPLDLDVPGDPSSAAFLVALAALSGAGELRIRGVGVNPTRTGFLRLARRMGARIRCEDRRSAGGEPVADLVVAGGAALRGIEVGPGEVPDAIDEIPVLAVLAARAEGETRITGAAELRVKETDRIAALVENLRAIGVQAEELADGLVVRGTDRPLAGPVRTHHDHRVAMAFGVLGAAGSATLLVDAPAVVEVSFPGFWDLLRRLSG
jgi:3-phosphoshikimate 1-carboxyvinyltransferase